MWVLGGKVEAGVLKNDVQSSANGSIWLQATGAAAFSARSAHAAAVLGGKIFLSGGHDGSAYLSDVWSSNDGSTWTLAATEKFSARDGHTLTTFKNTLQVIGGFDGSAQLNDAWISIDVDGVNWAQASSAAFSTGVRGHGAAVKDDKLWILGGQTSANIQTNNV